MEENNNNLTPDDKNKQKKPVKINSYWIYGAVIMMLILGQLLLFPSGTNSKISYDELKEAFRHQEGLTLKPNKTN